MLDSVKANTVFREIDASLTVSQEESGSWAPEKSSQNGLGIAALLDFLSIDVDYVKTRKKMVSAEKGSRTVLRE